MIGCSNGYTCNIRGNGGEWENSGGEWGEERGRVRESGEKSGGHGGECFITYACMELIVQ